MQQFHPILRGLAARLIPAFVLVVVASISPKAFALSTITAFGTTLNLPNSLPTGTVISRYTISLSELCGSASSCPKRFVRLWPYGGSTNERGPLIPTNVSGISTRLLMNGVPMPNATTTGVPVTSPLEVQLVRDNRTLAAGNLGGTNADPAYYYICLQSGACNSWDTGLRINLSATVRLINGTCSTPDQSVALPAMAMHKLKGVGSTGDQSGTKGFALRFNNCPPGFARVGYTLTPIGGPAPNFPGALPVAGGSTATGVAIQITGTNGTPATFKQSLPLSAYSTSTGGTYSIPMNARYIQTEATVTPGTISSMMSVLVDYQ
ncbi:fimbrial protein [Cupriavidus basilensis]|uniref:fimbrial protein n=1 Tax=Cupriavidus basilensis TaxID=68895 RepID=UPI0023E841CA|nr:fimbrial protein [Cupriavidus basilensis]MDF3885134.1 fimbrial protein [Cupriavidus basilensis]